MAPPSKYKDTYPADLIEMMEQGALNCDIFTKWGIHKDTFYQWMYDHPDLKEAYEIGKPRCEAWWVAAGKEAMAGKIKGFNSNLWIMFMNNKFGWVPGNKQVAESTTNTINISNLNILQNQNVPHLIETIQRLALKHPEAIEVECIEVKTDGSNNEPESKS